MKAMVVYDSTYRNTWAKKIIETMGVRDDSC